MLIARAARRTQQQWRRVLGADKPPGGTDPKSGWAAPLRRLSISRKLSAMAVAGGLVVAVLLVLVWGAMHVTDAVRAYVGGEGLWSKAQKSAVYHLTRYTYSGNEEEFEQFRDSLAITLHIRQARVELEKPEYAFAVVEDGFVNGGIAPQDVPNLVTAFRLFGDIGHMARAIEIWREGDAWIDELIAAAAAIRRERQAGPLSDASLQHHLGRIGEINSELAPLEDRFSQVLAAGARWAARTALWTIFLAAAVMMAIGLWLSSRLAREIRGGVGQLCEAAEHVARGDLDFRIAHIAADELGDLALSVNDMIARRREAERALERERVFLQTILENMSEAVIACDHRGKLWLFNRAARDLHGLEADTEPPAHWVGQHGELFHADGKTPLLAADDPLLSAVRGKRIVQQQVVIAPFGREPRSVLTNAQELSTESGDVIGAVVTLHDITDRIHAETALEERATELERANLDLASSNRELRRLYQAEAASEAKSRFLATMSHEIRTPLHGILGLLEVFGTQQLSPEQQRSLELMRESGDALKTLIDDVLDFAKIESGHMDLEMQPVNLVKLAGSVRSTQDPVAQKRGLGLRLELDEALPDTVLGDPGRLRQILLNLTSNALKFTRAGGSVTIRIARQLSALGDEQICIAVTDTGIGMREETRERVFDSFVQADSSTNRNFGGTGLGLAICKGLVGQMGGEIACESVLGKGSRFWFTVPLRTPGVGQPDSCPAPEAVAGGDDGEPFPPGPPVRVLIAEDHPVNQVVIEKQMARYNCECTIVPDGELALSRLRQGTYDLLITDIRMPRLGGYELVRMWRERERDLPEQPHLTIIGLSANADKEGLKKCMAVGMDDALVKPLTLADLDRCLRRWLGPSAQAA